MKREEILEKLMEQELVDKHEYVILADGFEEAFIGITANNPIQAIYDYWICLDFRPYRAFDIKRLAESSRLHMHRVWQDWP